MTTPDPLDTPIPTWAPTHSDVRDELPGRKKALDQVEPAVIEEMIRRRALSLLGELPAVLPGRLHAAARDYLTFAVASQLEDRLFPEQAGLPDSNAARLDRRAGAELTRLRGQLGENASTGDRAAWSGTVSLRGPRW